MTFEYPVQEDVTARYISWVLGQELRRTREGRGWSRGQLVARLPSGIGDRTLLSYEHGTRQLTVLRLLEICQVLEVSAADVLAHALQRARIHLENLVLRIDLRLLVEHRNEQFRPMVQWARNKLNKHPDGIAEILPSALVELADFIGCSHRDLTAYMAGFLPDSVEGSDDSGRRIKR